MIRNEIHKLYLNSGNLLASLSFFALALFCFSLALGSEEIILKRCGPILLWLLAILTLLFSTPLLLKAEYQAGLLDEVLLHPLPPSFYLLSKTGAEMLLLGLPLLVIGALFSLLCSFSFVESAQLLLTLLIGFPALSALGTLGGLLTLHTQGGGLLVSLLILPLTIPLLLFALSVMEMTRLGLDSFAPFCLLISMSLFLLILSVGAGQWALRLAVEA